VTEYEQDNSSSNQLNERLNSMASSPEGRSRTALMERIMAGSNESKSLDSSDLIVKETEISLPSIPKWKPEQMTKLREFMTKWMNRASPSMIAGLTYGFLTFLTPRNQLPTQNTQSLKKAILEANLVDDGLLHPEVFRLMRLSLQEFGPGKPVEFYGAICTRACAIRWLQEYLLDHDDA